MPKNYCIMQIRAESGKSALPICNYSQILYQFLTFTQNLKRSLNFSELSFMDDNQELQPGTTLSQEGTCYSDSGFDDVVIAINGRK